MRNEVLTFSEAISFKLDDKGLIGLKTIKVYQDDWPDGDFDFGDDKTNTEYLSRFETGELMCCLIEVVVSFKGLKGSNVLGMCHVRSAFLEDDIKYHVNEYHMAQEATMELIDNLKALKQEIV